MTTYRLGVVGLGEGRSIMSAALASDRWQLHAICDLNEDVCRERAEEFGFARWTTRYSELLEDPEIDVIAIYTPDQLHHEHVRLALEAGKHVVCTKPLLVSLEGAEELIRLAERSGKHVFVGQSSRFFEPMLHQRRDFEAGRHGELQTVEAHYITDGRWFLERGWSRQQGFSWMYNFMIHAADLVRWYMPGELEVTGYGQCSSTSRDYGVEAWDSMRFVVRDEVGRIGTIAGSYTMPGLGRDAEPSIGCTLRGTQGSSRAEYLNLTYHTHFSGEGKRRQDFADKHGYYFRFEGESHHAGEYQNYIEYFAQCLDRGAAPLPDIREGVTTIALLEAMRRSADRGGERVRVSEVLKDYGIDG
ncbi:Gfo/Idh/MocA family oxidoreductase [Paenibacillus sp. IB182496]|uniref:Gfo/Idh/MocA family oxidoreductase n=1 Tax=Paenibacillus sabuli TaxID=2772509 RepID=A0A927BV73_9BACL|nr:Gfo/Idh/MocA family oxidoreductase [Paenibacillus sabuli]MBD2845963.1 Gfo/Idh/MocA family oxidoreductase [Paenibacillus sabuli]